MILHPSCCSIAPKLGTVKSFPEPIAFFVEAALGGIIGIIGGIIIAYIISVGANLLGYDWEFKVSFLSIILSVGVSAAVGLVFGLFPARKASRLEPVEALRYE